TGRSGRAVAGSGCRAPAARERRRACAHRPGQVSRTAAARRIRRIARRPGWTPGRVPREPRRGLADDRLGRARMSENWNEHREGGGRFALWLIRSIGLTFGRRCSRVLLYPITLYFFLRRREERRASYEYLQR